MTWRHSSGWTGAGRPAGRPAVTSLDGEALGLGVGDEVLLPGLHGGGQVGLVGDRFSGNSRLLPESGQVYDVRSGWRLRDGEWRMTSIEWTPKLR